MFLQIIPRHYDRMALLQHGSFFARCFHVIRATKRDVQDEYTDKGMDDIFILHLTIRNYLATGPLSVYGRLWTHALSWRTEAKTMKKMFFSFGLCSPSVGIVSGDREMRPRRIEA